LSPTIEVVHNIPFTAIDHGDIYNIPGISEVVMWIELELISIDAKVFSDILPHYTDTKPIVDQVIDLDHIIEAKYPDIC
jgi:hypothetical protein